MNEQPCQVLCAALPDTGYGGEAGAATLEAQLARHLDRATLLPIGRLRRAPDRLRSMLGRLLLRHALHARGVTAPPWQFELGPCGKPRLRGGAVEFNLSHAGRWVVCAVSSAPVGVDIEQVRDIDLGIAERFFQRREYLALLAHAPRLRSDYFFRLWTAKEAYVKALGLGLQRDFSSFAVLAGADGRWCVHDPLVDPQRLALAYLPCAPGYRLALCGAAAPPSACTVLDLGCLSL